MITFTRKAPVFVFFRLPGLSFVFKSLGLRPLFSVLKLDLEGEASFYSIKKRPFAAFFLLSQKLGAQVFLNKKQLRRTFMTFFLCWIFPFLNGMFIIFPHKVVCFSDYTNHFCCYEITLVLPLWPGLKLSLDLLPLWI